MAVLEKGKYKGEYKEGNNRYHMFSPEKIAVNGDVRYVRIGDYNMEFGSNRNYSLIEVNDEEKKLIGEQSN
jgi:hypothetical protein